MSGFTEDEEVIAAAYLHDTLEDTDTTLDELVENFGERVAQFVHDLTDKYTKEEYPNLNRAERKHLEALRLKGVRPESKLIKYFDIMDNSSSIFHHDTRFAKKYLKEKQFIMSYSLADVEFN